MKTKNTLLLLVFAMLLATAAPAQTVGGIKNITDNKAGISYNANARTVISNYTVQPEDHTILVDATTAAVTITLPPVGAKAFRYLVVKKTDSGGNAVTVSAVGGALIDGASTVSLSAQYQTVLLHANATAWSKLGNPGSTTNSGTYTQTSSSAAAFATGPNGNTNPVFRTDNSASSSATGVVVKGAAAGSGATVTAISSGTNEGLKIDAKGSGDLTLQGTATGNVIANRLLSTDLTEVVTATNVITAAESGSVFFLNSSTEFVSTLPAPAAGLHYTFIVTAAPSGDSYTVVTNSSSNIIKGKQISVAGDAGDTGTGDDTISFVDGQAVAGDRVEVWCDGTNWFAVGISNVAAGLTFTTAS